jgi:blue copper oxidase
MKHSLSRRNFLRLTGGAFVAMNLSALPGLTPRSQSTTPTDLEINLTAEPAEINIFDGTATQVWVYRGEVVQGDPEALQTLNHSYLGPTIRVRRGQRLIVHFTNTLFQDSLIHWHGLHLPEEMDSHPRYAVGTGETYTYDFVVTARAGTYWYHPHAHHLTAEQVYKGLAGMLIVTDDEEEALGLPSGDYDLPIILQDRMFNGEQLVYGDDMTAQMMGFLGEQTLTNGLAFPPLIETRAYRLRLLNGSNARIYKLAWEDGTPLNVIGTDGGLLEAPVQRDYVMLSPGERIDLWADFSGRTLNSELRLMSLAFTGAEAGGSMEGMMEEPVLPNGAEFVAATFFIGAESSERLTLPQTLSTINRYQLADAVNADAPRTFEIAMQSSMAWTLNGRSFEMEGVTEEETVRLNTLEVWEFVNVVNADQSEHQHMEGMDMSSMGSATADQMAHPMHIHGGQFQVIERTVDERFREAWDSVSAGYVDEGWKDTVLLMPGERVKLLMRFEDYTGLFVFHCHNLEHEDGGLMRNYAVVN